MQRKIIFSPGESYHIYNRGTDKRVIFLDSADRKRFVLLLKVANNENPIIIREIKKILEAGIKIPNQGESLVNIGAWCLMSNHFHILINEKIEGGISKFMSKLLTAYTMYFNKKYERKGSLFEGVFQAHHANNDEYLKYLFSYIHLNPIKTIDPLWKKNGLKDFSKSRDYLEKYLYSSYLDYLDYDREEKEILNKEAFPKYFQNPEVFKDNIFDWLKFDQQDFNLPRTPLGKLLSIKD